MALTLTFPAGDEKEVSLGNMRAKIVEVAAAAADYTTGGYANLLFGLRVVYGALVIGGNPLWAAYDVRWDSVNGKLMVFYPTGGGTVPVNVGDPAITAGATPVASSAANGSAPLTAGRAKEVANATDLSGLGVLRLLVLGN